MNVAGGVALMNTAMILPLFTAEFGGDPSNLGNAVTIIVIVGFLYMMTPELDNALERVAQAIQSRGETDE